MMAGSGGDGGGGGGSGDAGNTLATTGTEVPKVCLNCGKNNHVTRMCRFKCTMCGLKFCGAGHGDKKCPLKCGGAMPARTAILNAIGKPVPEFLYDKLKAKKEEMDGGGTAGGTHFSLGGDDQSA